MGELLSSSCPSCGEPMVPNVSTLDAGGVAWICLNAACPELAAGELEAEDLVEAGVPQALAGRLARLIAAYAAGPQAPPPRTEDLQPWTGLERFRREVIAVERLARDASHTASRLAAAVHFECGAPGADDALAAREDLAVASALCSLAGRTAKYARVSVDEIDPELPGFNGPHGG